MHLWLGLSTSSLQLVVVLATELGVPPSYNLNADDFMPTSMLHFKENKIDQLLGHV